MNLAEHTATPGPAPYGESLTIEVVCRTRRDGEATKHPITIHSDWSVATGHDLEAERVAAAFGSYLSCIELVDTVLPVLRDGVALWTRVGTSPIRAEGRRWTVAGCHCASGKTFGSARAAAAYARSTLHLARHARVDEHLLKRLLGAVSAAYGDLSQPPDHAAANLVSETWGLARLWDAGLSPEDVQRLHGRIWPAGGALPDLFYLRTHYGAHVADDCLRAVIAATGSTDDLMWTLLTPQPIDRMDPTVRVAWLKVGARRSAVLDLLRVGYTVAEARELSKRIDRALPLTATTLATWARSGCKPSAAELARLHHVRGDCWYTPSKGAIDGLRKQASQCGIEATPTQVGVVLAVAGYGRLALRMLRAGARGVAGAARLMAEWNSS